MQLVVTLPEELVAEAAKLAKELGMVRSQLYERALREFVERHSPDRITASLNAVCDKVGADSDFAVETSMHMLKKADKNH